MQITGAVLEVSGASAPFAESRPFTVGALELDPPGPGELLVRIEAAGVCHSDLSVVDGNRRRPVPMLLGHEASGIVEQVGEDVDDLRAGVRVVMTFLPRCGECAGCATDGRLPCEVGTAANNAGSLVGGGIATAPIDRSKRRRLGRGPPSLGGQWLCDARRGQSHLRRRRWPPMFRPRSPRCWAALSSPAAAPF